MARALATRPKVLLADESLGGLDEAEMEQAAQMLKRIRDEKGVTIIWVEHIMGVLMRVIDRCLVLDHGELIAQGKPHEVTHDPRVVEVYLGTDAHAVQQQTKALAEGSGGQRRMTTMLKLQDVDRGLRHLPGPVRRVARSEGGRGVAVIGPNGAGKTTLLRAISKLIPVTGGTLEMEGRRYNDLPSHEIIGLGIAQVPEGRRLFPRLTVEDNLRMGAFLPAARASTSPSGSTTSTRCSRA
jgi:ABC-type branched-subunit amino acid transport system ATPase component